MLQRPNPDRRPDRLRYILPPGKFDLNLSSFPEGRWYFNPFSWQLLFVLGRLVCLDEREKQNAGPFARFQEIPTLRIAAWAYLFVALVVDGGRGNSRNWARVHSGLRARHLPSQ